MTCRFCGFNFKAALILVLLVGGARCKYDFRGSGVEQLGNLLPSVLYDLLVLRAKSIAAGRIPPLIGNMRRKRL
ncbi:MAG: hypothetical protein M2R45_02015 [Verrucomicrobia subdivision 3 bacterium]|nr:hypothetical protein [Limisphaerales bacterium]MCS1414833.1 hypothetical protein [Limisphaerales bacterium]